MVFLDINTFFSPKAGGIRTFHQAKIAWFQGQSEHRYFLVYPGPGFRIRAAGPQVTLVEAFGPALAGDAHGYRLLLDYARVFRVLRRARPDVLEAGDPWLTGLFCLILKRLRLYRGLLASFYHSDPVPSYLEPWAARGRGRPLKRLAALALGRIFYRLQRGYDVTAVSSRGLEESLRARGLPVVRMPFGVPAAFLAAAGPADPGAMAAGARSAAAAESPRPARLLYAGRLDREKGVELILEILPALLGEGRLHVSVAGRGALAARFEAVNLPRYRYLGYLPDPERMRALYDSHHLLLAPGPFETFGLGVLEAMARGLVVVGPDRGGTGELLRQAGSPFLFQAGDAADFLRAVRDAVACDWERESRRSRELARTYGTWDEAVGRMVGSYRSLAAR